MDAAMAKLFAADAASDVTRRAVQLFGGYGYTREYPVERMMRDAKITEICMRALPRSSAWSSPAIWALSN